MARRIATAFASGGMPIFTLIWLGQLVSLVGSGLTEFALGVWVYQRTGAATDFALIVFLIALPHACWSRRSPARWSTAGTAAG